MEPSSSPVAAAVAAVLGTDDLLREILVRVDHPTCLVNAALVSKRWLRHASDPAFLYRFRRLHPPRLLGLYVQKQLNASRPPLFVPLPHPPELDVVFRRGRFEVAAWNGLRYVVRCRNGRFIAVLYEKLCYNFCACSPLHPRDLPVFMSRPSLEWDDESIQFDQYEFLPEDGGNGLSWTLVRLMCSGPKVFGKKFVLYPWG